LDIWAREASGGRRSFLRLAVASVIGGASVVLHSRSTFAARGRAAGQTCRNDSDCATGYCALIDPKHSRGVCEYICESEFGASVC
jgi:hypothetical protein